MCSSSIDLLTWDSVIKPMGIYDGQITIQDDGAVCNGIYEGIYNTSTNGRTRLMAHSESDLSDFGDLLDNASHTPIKGVNERLAEYDSMVKRIRQEISDCIDEDKNDDDDPDDVTKILPREFLKASMTQENLLYPLIRKHTNPTVGDDTNQEALQDAHAVRRNESKTARVKPRSISSPHLERGSLKSILRNRTENRKDCRSESISDIRTQPTKSDQAIQVCDCLPQSSRSDVGTQVSNSVRFRKDMATQAGTLAETKRKTSAQWVMSAAEKVIEPFLTSSRLRTSRRDCYERDADVAPRFMPETPYAMPRSCISNSSSSSSTTEQQRTFAVAAGIAFGVTFGLGGTLIAAIRM